jgi:hypothetical protein
MFEAVSIVVLGNMNPAIHQPSWYRAVKVLKADEESAAREHPQLLVSPTLTAFSTGVFRIVCRLDRWEILSEKPEQLARVAEVASGTFDRLRDTPATVVGITYMVHRPLAGEKRVSPILQATLRRALPFFASSTFATFTGATERNGVRETVTVEPSRQRQDAVFVGFGIELEQQPQALFDVNQLVDENFSPHLQRGRDLANQIVQTLEQADER